MKQAHSIPISLDIVTGTMATVEGGYDYDFVQPPPEELLCNWCKLPCREAQSMENRVYCKRCTLKVKSSASVSYIFMCNNEISVHVWL